MRFTTNFKMLATTTTSGRMSFLSEALPPVAIACLSSDKQNAIQRAKAYVRQAGRALGGGCAYNSRWPRIIERMRIALEGDAALVGTAADMRSLLGELAP